MYSVVLMAALTAGVDTPSFGHGCHGGGWGGHGCHGYGGCYGSCYGGGWGCYGSCCGGGWGCYGGWGYGGCCGGGWGCYGGWGSCYGCYGGAWGVPGASYQIMPTVPAGAKPMEPAPPPKEAPKPGAAAAPGSAKLIIDVPDNAKVYVDDQLLQTPAGKRSFSTPPLERGVAYYYIFRAEVVVDGKSHSESKRVIVRAGDTSQLAFSELAAAIKGGKPNGVASASR